MINRKAQIDFTTGLLIRITAALIIVLTLPVIITNPSNLPARIFFAFGNFLLVIGGNIK
ncbi:MAG: hypothetical protein AABX65_04325 [Nanoarchaeota archaeon]